jgi:ketosteroid isomerase-like protein
MTVTSADVETVRRFYQAVAARDMAAAESCFAPDAVWHLPGKSVIVGDHHGWPAIRDDFLAKLGPLSGIRSGPSCLMLRSGRSSSWRCSMRPPLAGGGAWISRVAS